MSLPRLSRPGPLGVGDRWVSREDVINLARPKQVPNLIVETREKQTPATPLERYVRTEQDAETA